MKLKDFDRICIVIKERLFIIYNLFRNDYLFEILFIFLVSFLSLIYVLKWINLRTQNPHTKIIREEVQ